MYRIMIVDDEAMSANTLKRYIDTHLPAFRVVGTYRNGQEALDAFCAAPADILLADIRMPILDGLSAGGASEHAHPGLYAHYHQQLRRI